LKTIDDVRAAIVNLALPYDYMAVVALGSYGRLEAHEDASDFEWLVIYDDKHVNVHEATTAQSKLTSVFADIFGRERLSVSKTFGQTSDLTGLGTLVGGLGETNQMLTYRTLTLTEGIPISPGQGYNRTLRALAYVYGRSHTGGHRLLSVATELARYYRVVRASYKFKIDEEGKPWGVRSIKHRSYRRFAYFSSALHFVVLGPRIDYVTARLFDIDAVVEYFETMNQPPIERLAVALKAISADEVAQPSLVIYERIHRALASASIRSHLDQLDAADRFDDDIYRQIRQDCISLHAELAETVMRLPADTRRQLIEMFLL